MYFAEQRVTYYPNVLDVDRCDASDVFDKCVKILPRQAANIDIIQ